MYRSCRCSPAPSSWLGASTTGAGVDAGDAVGSAACAPHGRVNAMLEANKAQAKGVRRTKGEPTMAASGGFGTAVASIRRMTRRAYIVTSPDRSEIRAVSTRESMCRPPGDSRGPWTAVYDRLVLTRPMLRGLFVAVTLSVAACGGSSSGTPTVNASGEYSGSVTNGANSCPGPWNMGETNVLNMTVTQT